MLNLLSEVKALFSTYKKTLWCDNCERDFEQVLRKGHRLAKDPELSVTHVVEDKWFKPDLKKIYKGIVACPRCGCTSQISMKEKVNVENPRIEEPGKPE